MHNEGFEADIFDGNFHKHNSQMRSTTQFEQFSHNGSTAHLQGKQQQQQQQQERQQSSAFSTCCRRFSSLMLSHLGTFLIVVLYVLMGGFLFNYLETDNEISSCENKELKYINKRNEAVDKLYNIAQVGNATLAKSAILDEVILFAKDLYSLSFDPELNCSSLRVEGGDTVSWNMVNAAYFCVTIVTTIGYGHIAPATQWGQIVCMIYSILGIPLMLLFLTKIGEPTAMVFRAFYLNIFCCKCFVKSAPAVRRAEEQKATSWETVEAGGDGKKPPMKVHVIDDDEDDYEDEDEADEIVNIPITVTLMLLILYILIGAGVFSIWEKDWTLVEGTYFSFITLTTIGFGDYVPGRDGPFDDPAVITELLVGSVYCLFGLAMLSMCISLIQDEIAAKFRWVGLKLGIIKPPPPEDDDSDDDDSDDDDSDDSGSDDGVEDGSVHGEKKEKVEVAEKMEEEVVVSQRISTSVGRGDSSNGKERWSASNNGDSEV